MPPKESLISVVEIVRLVDWWTDAVLHKLTIKAKGESIQPCIHNVPKAPATTFLCKLKLSRL